jgi:hypothetical protein
MWGLVQTILNIIEARRFCRNLDAQGRRMPLEELKSELTAGYGTIIEEVDYGNTGPRLFWWTKDDVFAIGQPLTDSEEIRAVIRGKRFHEFNSRVLSEYLDEYLGKGILLSMPNQHKSSAFISYKYPKIQIATVYRELGNAATAWAAS